jgi:hypothetical protein
LRRGSTRARRPAIRPIRPSNASRQRVGSMLDLRPPSLRQSTQLTTS